MSREVELLGAVIANLQGRLECESATNETLTRLIKAKGLEQARADEIAQEEIGGLRRENAQLRSAMDRAIAELRLRIKDQAEFDGVFNSLNRIHR